MPPRTAAQPTAMFVLAISGSDSIDAKTRLRKVPDELDHPRLFIGPGRCQDGPAILTIFRGSKLARPLTEAGATA
jgi:hypothetical protein